MADTTTPTPGNAALAFHFSPSFDVRAILRDGEPWFVAKDVLAALDYSGASNASRVIAHVPEEWRGVNPIHTPSGEQQMAVLSEQGLYFFLGRSDKPKALPFQKWLAGTVLPAIRKTGRYEVANPPSPVHPAREQLNAQDLRALQNLVHLASHPMRCSGAWSQGIWAQLRRVTGNPAPAGWFVDQIPALGAEMGRILATCHQVAAVQRDIERVAVRRIFRRGEDAQAVLAHIDALAAEATQQIQGQLERLPPHYITHDVQRFLARGREPQA
jgi:prophage antirepressor-like protein